MKNYYQIIVGIPKKPNSAKHPDTSIRRVKHEKPLTAFEAKMVRFRAYIFKKTREFNITSDKITKDKRILLKKEALQYAGLIKL